VRGADAKSRSKLIKCDESDESVKSVLRDAVVAGTRDAQLGSRRSNGDEVPIWRRSGWSRVRAQGKKPYHGDAYTWLLTAMCCKRHEC